MMLREKNGNINIRVNHIAQRPLEKGPVVAEPEEFQPFDLEALRNSADNKPSRSSSRREVYVPQTA